MNKKDKSDIEVVRAARWGSLTELESEDTQGSDNIHYTLFYTNVFRNTLYIHYRENSVLDINVFNETLFFFYPKKHFSCSKSSKKCENRDKSRCQEVDGSCGEVGLRQENTRDYKGQVDLEPRILAKKGLGSCECLIQY